MESHAPAATQQSTNARSVQAIPIVQSAIMILKETRPVEQVVLPAQHPQASLQMDWHVSYVARRSQTAWSATQEELSAQNATQDLSRMEVEQAARPAHKTSFRR